MNTSAFFRQRLKRLHAYGVGSTNALTGAFTLSFASVFFHIYLTSIANLPSPAGASDSKEPLFTAADAQV